MDSGLRRRRKWRRWGAGREGQVRECVNVGKAWRSAGGCWREEGREVKALR